MMEDFIERCNRAKNETETSLKDKKLVEFDFNKLRNHPNPFTVYFFGVAIEVDPCILNDLYFVQGLDAEQEFKLIIMYECVIKHFKYFVDDPDILSALAYMVNEHLINGSHDIKVYL